LPHAASTGALVYDEVSGEGEPIVLIPGLGMTTAAWEPVCDRLVPSHRVVVVDPRGAGQSDRPDAPYTGEAMSDDLVAVLDDACIERAHLVGHSMGGMIAQEVAIRHADRVRSLILAATYAATDDWSRRVLEVRRMLIERLGLQEQFRMSLLFVFSPWSFRTRRELIAALEQRLRADPPEPRAYLRQLDFCVQHDARECLARISVPSLVVSGAGDVLTSAIQGRELSELIPGARHQEHPEASHGLIWEESGSFADLVSAFLAEHHAAI
jgi:3-oxoadipate enol-lactonase